MKYRRLAGITIIFVLILGLLFSKVELKNKRYHQHKEAKVRAEEVITKDEFATHLPIIDIKTDEPIPISCEKTIKENGKKSIIKNYDVVKSEFKYIQNIDKENKRKDEPVFLTNAYIRTRGSSSRLFDKKGYLVEFQNDDYSEKRNIEIDNMSADSEWVLHGPYLDRTLIRNYMSYNIAGEIMDYSPNVRFCELFLNNEYMGLYLLTEKNSYNENGRINIEKTNSKLSTTSYIIKIDREKNEKYRIETFFEAMSKKNTLSSVNEILYPKKTLTKSQHEYIEKEINKVEKTLMSNNFQDKKEGYRKYIDVDSFVDYYIISEFTENLDATKYSTYIYKEPKGKIKIAVWDFNNAYNNYENINIENSELFFTHLWWYKYLFKDEYFTNKVLDRYKELRKTVLSDEYLIDYIDDTVEYLGPAIDRNFKRWPNALKEKKLTPKYKNKYDYKESVDFLKKEIKNRGKYMDKNMKSIKYFSHYSTIKY